MLVILLSLVAAAGPVEDAEAAYAASDWKTAAKAYKKVVKAEPGNATAWLRLASAQHATDDWKGAIASNKKALEAGFPVVWMVEYNIACAQARAGKPEAAIAALERAVAAGLANPDKLSGDDDLASVRDKPGWDAVIAGAKKNAAPCEHDPRFAAFDFFLGDWELHSGGVLAGTNHIEKVQRGCAIEESWTSRTGRTGTSLTALDPATDTWSQFWMSDSGWRIYMEGRLNARGAMVLAGPDGQLPDKGSLTRATWAPKDPDVVNYVLESSTDDGETWAITFEGQYRRVASE